MGGGGWVKIKIKDHPSPAEAEIRAELGNRLACLFAFVYYVFMYSSIKKNATQNFFNFGVRKILLHLIATEYP